jgi:hypothetical protein
MLTATLEKAFAEASKLSSRQQDTLGAWILQEIASERRWEKAFSDSPDEFAQLAEETLEEKKFGSEVTPPKDVKKPFSLEFTELTDEDLEKKLQAFEMKYKLDSETLYQLYQQGKAPEWIEDRILWAGLYRLKKDEDDME